MAAEETVLIIGGGQAGGQVAQHLIANAFSGRIVLASGEGHLPYERPPLSKAVLQGAAVEDSIFLYPPDRWQQERLELILAEQVVEIDTAGKRAFFNSGRTTAYDILVMATGGEPYVPRIRGAELARNLRSLDDSRLLREELGRAESIAIIGGGVIGMEVAATASSLGCRVTVIEAGARVMARILPPIVSTWLENLHRSKGCRIETQAVVEGIEKTADRFEVHFGTDVVPCDIVLMATGIVPNSHLLPQDAIGPTRGIVTDEYGRVRGHDGLFAVGDVAESFNPLYGRTIRLETWRNADRQAKAIARTICGIETAHCETPWMWSDQLDRNIQVVGLWQEGADIVVRGPCGDPGSSVFWLNNGVIAGGVLIDNGRDRRFLEKLVETKAQVPPDALADPVVSLKLLA